MSNLWCRLKCAWLCLTAPKLIVGAYRSTGKDELNANLTILNLNLNQLHTATADMDRRAERVHDEYQQRKALQSALTILTSPTP